MPNWPIGSGSRPPSPRGTRLARLAMGRVGKSSTRQVLHIDDGWATPNRCRTGQLAAGLDRLRLEERGWLASQWGESENRRHAKYYTLTTAGRRQIDAELANWQRVSTAIASRNEVGSPRNGASRKIVDTPSTTH